MKTIADSFNEHNAKETANSQPPVDGEGCKCGDCVSYRAGVAPTTRSKSAAEYEADHAAAINAAAAAQAKTIADAAAAKAAADAAANQTPTV